MDIGQWFPLGAGRSLCARGLRTDTTPPLLACTLQARTHRGHKRRQARVALGGDCFDVRILVESLQQYLGGREVAEQVQAKQLLADRDREVDAVKVSTYS